MIKRILVGFGGTEYSLVAVKRAVELAKIHDASLAAVTVIDINRLMNVGAVPIRGMDAARKAANRRIKNAMEGMEKAINAFEESCKEAGVDYSIERAIGDTFETLVPLSRYFDINILGLALFRSTTNSPFFGIGNGPSRSVSRTGPSPFNSKHNPSAP